MKLVQNGFTSLDDIDRLRTNKHILKTTFFIHGVQKSISYKYSKSMLGRFGLLFFIYTISMYLNQFNPTFLTLLFSIRTEFY